ncbi:hypothetical protein [Actinoplanes sp. DH11]|uniref:hypothetical protein n=1 Tax=Actinoplanes sp. DH11 TaxID=2857011 RepID=UPI001E4A414A|nr:hypothetical protein [Actinoplanes sp. DH11]
MTLGSGSLEHAEADKGEARTVDDGRDFELERYKFILQQLHTVNENVHRFLGLFQAIATGLLTVGIALFVGYKKWDLAPDIAATGIEAVMWLITLTAGFTLLLVVAGVFSWIDYRREECQLLERHVRLNARSAPRLSNFWRWYETYVVLFILLAIVFLWFYVNAVILPTIVSSA